MARLRLCLIFFSLTGGFLAALLIYSSIHESEVWPGHVAATGQVVRTLGLTDLSLSSEARYTRHPSQADLFSAFQDYPGAFEHFPTGSMIQPYPVGIKTRFYIIPANQLEK